MYARAMDVAISRLRAELAKWIDRARAGEEIVITDRGIPVVRLLPVHTAPLLDQLVQRGVLSKPVSSQRPTARSVVRARASGPVAELVSAQRR
jgi:prevent-host-death family protein